MTEEEEQPSDQGVWLEESIGNSKLYTRVYGDNHAETPSSSKNEPLKYGQKIYNSGNWGSEHSISNFALISCFIQSNSKDTVVSALVLAKSKDSVGDQFVDGSGKPIGKVGQIVRPIPSAPRARIAEGTVIENYQCTARIDLVPRLWQAPNQFKDLRIDTSFTQDLKPLCGDRVHLISEGGDLVGGVVTHVDITVKVDSCWYFNVFAVKSEIESCPSRSSSLLTGLVVDKLNRPLGLQIPVENNGQLLFSPMNKVLGQFNAKLI